MITKKTIKTQIEHIFYEEARKILPIKFISRDIQYTIIIRKESTYSVVYITLPNWSVFDFRNLNLVFVIKNTERLIPNIMLDVLAVSIKSDIQNIIVDRLKKITHEEK